MVLAVLILKFLLPATWNLWLRFSLEVAIGVAAYSIALLVMYPERIKILVKLMRDLISGVPAAV